MMHRFSLRLFALGLVLGAVGAAAVLAAQAYASGSQYGPGYGSSGSSSTGAKATTAVVRSARTKLGRVLVDGRGRTLYLFEKDKSTASTCYGGCAGVWPPLVTKGKPIAGAGVKASLLGTTKRKDGTLAVTYNGHPLYRYVADTRPGSEKGQGINEFGAQWYVLSPAGRKVDND